MNHDKQELHRLPRDLAEWYLSDYVEDLASDAQTIRDDIQHWEMVMGDHKLFPNADCEGLSKFLDAAYNYLGTPRQ